MASPIVSQKNTPGDQIMITQIEEAVLEALVNEMTCTGYFYDTGIDGDPRRNRYTLPNGRQFAVCIVEVTQTNKT
jgi:hypothetical protein